MDSVKELLDHLGVSVKDEQGGLKTTDEVWSEIAKMMGLLSKDHVKTALDILFRDVQWSRLKPPSVP